MRQRDSSNSQPTTVYSKQYTAVISALSLLYVIVSFGFAGIPGISRLALYSASLLLVLTVINFNRLRIPAWAILMLIFYAFITIPSFALEKPAYDKLGKVVAAFMGTISIGLTLQNRLLSYKIVAYGALIGAVLNIIAVHMGIDTAPINDKERYSGLMGNSNALSIAMAFSGFLVWLFPERYNWPTRLLGVVVTLYGMYISGSRKGLMLAVALLLLIFVNRVVQLSKIKLVIYGSCILTFVIALYAWIIHMTTKYATNILAVDRFLKGFEGQNKSFTDRLRLIDVGVGLWKESPIFGHGLSQFANISGFGVYSHNNYIELAVSGGIIAIILFYSIHITIFHKALLQPIALRLRLIIFISAIFLLDMAAVTFYDKAMLCTLATLLTADRQNKHGLEGGKHLC